MGWAGEREKKNGSEREAVVAEGVEGKIEGVRKSYRGEE